MGTELSLRDPLTTSTSVNVASSRQTRLGEDRTYLLLSMSARAVARPDGAHVFIPIFLTFVWRDRRLGLIKLVRTLPVLVIPVALPAISGMWTGP